MEVSILSGSFGLNYLYRADGVKVRKTYSMGGGKGQSKSYQYTDYLDGFQYSYSETVAPCPWCRTSVAYEEQAFKEPAIIPGTIPMAWSLDFVPTSEGFFSFTENRYIYQYRDHLGNARVSYAKNSQGAIEVTDVNNYYAFGLNHIGANKALLGGYQNYKYNGKEIQETGMYDYGARFYMPDIGRWGVVDPLAEKYRRWSPYNYVMNNPIRYIDPDGRFIIDPNATKEQRAILQRAIYLAQSLVQDEKVLKSMMKWGQMSRETILNDLADGKGPTLYIKDLSKLKVRAFATYKGNGRGTGEFNINSNNLDEIQNLSEGEEQSNLLFLIATSILHEDVHKGDDVDGIDNPEEEGDKFEKEAFGRDVQRRTVSDIRSESYSRLKKRLSDSFITESLKMSTEIQKYEEKKKDNIRTKKDQNENIIKYKK